MSDGVFTFMGKEYPYFRHEHNNTLDNERAIEVPLARDIVKSCDGRVLEVGNVLNYYFDDLVHDVVDKNEKGRGVVTVDIEAYEPTEPYDLIVSISTLEHVGWNEQKYGAADAPDPSKLRRVLERLKSMLAPDGRMFHTMPIGYNPPMDAQIQEDDLGLKASYLCRSGKTEWSESDKKRAMQTEYGRPFTAANGLYIGEWPT